MRAWDMSGLSWAGFNIFGERKSIDEVQRLMRVEGRVVALEARIAQLEILLEVEKERNAKTTVRHRE